MCESDFIHNEVMNHSTIVVLQIDNLLFAAVDSPGKPLAPECKKKGAT